MTISATIIADSVNLNGVRIITYELEYPRFLHAELLTHRVFSRNSASSRAIPINTMLDNIQAEPAAPIHWGKNQSGMQAKEELQEPEKSRVQSLWIASMQSAVHYCDAMSDAGAHKQIANRITEPFQHMKVVVTSTEWENWFWLRYHPDAQPEIMELARIMKESYDCSKPERLRHGEWHVPYVQTHRSSDGTLTYWDDELAQITKKQALMVSASCCAQVSYRKSDTSLEKAEMIFKRLIESEPCHASPVEHQAMCHSVEWVAEWPEGFTHVDRKGYLWSNNFRSWIQHRALIPNNSKKG